MDYFRGLERILGNIVVPFLPPGTYKAKGGGAKRILFIKFLFTL